MLCLKRYKGIGADCGYLVLSVLRRTPRRGIAACITHDVEVRSLEIEGGLEDSTREAEKLRTKVISVVPHRFVLFEPNPYLRVW